MGLLKTLELVDKQEAVLVDSVPIEGAGQVLDSYNLLAAGIRQALRQLAEQEWGDGAAGGAASGLERVPGPRDQGKAAVDWNSQEGPRQVLARLVEDAGRIREEIERVLKQESGAAAVGASTPVAPDSPVQTAGAQSPGAPVAATMESAEPVAQDPTEPVAQDLAQPATQDLAQPAAQDPAQPAAQDPAQPAAQEPSPPQAAQPVAQDPAQPAAQEPAQPAAQDPAPLVAAPTDTQTAPPAPASTGTPAGGPGVLPAPAPKIPEPLQQTAAALAAVIAHDVEFGPDGWSKDCGSRRPVVG